MFPVTLLTKQNFEENTTLSVGPWGGQDGAYWDDGVKNGVRQVVICHGAAIDSIQFEYHEKQGSFVWSYKHGGTGCFKTNKIKLDYPEEYLVSVSGHYGSIENYGPVLIRSLTFESNKKKYGPFGIQHGTHFSFPASGGKVVGFHGRSSWYLDAIGFYSKPQQNLSNYPTTAPPSHYPTAASPSRYPTAASPSHYPTAAPPSHYPTAAPPSQTYNMPVGKYRGPIDAEQGIPDSGIIYGPTTYTRQFVPFETWGGISGALIYDYSNQVGAFNQTNMINGGSTMSPAKSVSYGPWGGSGGTIFDDGVYAGVREVHITRSGGLVSMRVCYDSDGQAVWGNKNGGSGGIRLDKIAFDYPSEILTHISGYYGSTILRGPMVVKSITFHTNKRKYGPFGDEQGISFSSASNKGRVVGFHGRKGWFIDSIGVHVIEEPVPPFGSLLRISRDSVSTSDPKAYEVVPGSVKEPATWTSGPWGGNGGKPWDDGEFAGVKSIYLTKGEAIYCIQIEYDRNGQSVWSVRHGGGSERSSHMIKLDYPAEVLTSISGYFDYLNGDETKNVIKSLTFYTNKAKYGPYGEESGTSFPSTKTEGRIVGFHGRSSCFLNSIGVRMQAWPNERDSAPQGLLGDRGGAGKMAIQKFFN